MGYRQFHHLIILVQLVVANIKIVVASILSINIAYITFFLFAKKMQKMIGSFIIQLFDIGILLAKVSSLIILVAMIKFNVCLFKVI